MSGKWRLPLVRSVVLFSVILAGCGGDDSTGEGGACTFTHECSEGLSCINKVCSPGNDSGHTCITDGQCGLNMQCVHGICQPPGTECTLDSDCADEMVCTAGNCVDSTAIADCVLDEDCLEGETCQGGVCISDSPQCAADDDCPSGNCNETTGQCEDPTTCDTDAQCDDLKPCSVDTCTPEGCTHVASTEAGCCETSANCTPANPCELVACEDFVCVPSEKPNCCLSDSDCDDGDINTADHCESYLCVHEIQPDCVLTSQCSDGNACTEDLCTAGTCSNSPIAGCCNSDADCDDNDSNTVDTCTNNGCTHQAVGPCTSNTQCFDGNPCTDDVCSEGNCSFPPNLAPTCQCQTNADCAGDKGGACTLLEDGPNSMGLYCVTKAGDKLAGESCVMNFQCETGFCASLSGGAICFGGCLSDSDCSGASECSSVSVEMDDGTVETFPACIVPPDSCGGDYDCTGTDICLPVAGDLDFTLDTACLPPDPGTQGPGDTCTDDADCQSGLCMTVPELGQDLCWSACQDNGDCDIGLNCYTNRVYFIFDKDNADPTDDAFYSLNMCVPDIGSWDSCQGDSDCSMFEYCGIYLNKTQTNWELHCVESPNTVGFDPGTSCMSDSSCQSDNCLDVSGQSFCFGVCGNNLDCGGLSTCTTIEDMIINDWDDTDDTNDVTAPLQVCLP